MSHPGLITITFLDRSNLLRRPSKKPKKFKFWHENKDLHVNNLKNLLQQPFLRNVSHIVPVVKSSDQTKKTKQH
jgi:hypothetical protein